MGFNEGPPPLSRVWRIRWVSRLSFAFVLTMSLYSFWTNYALLPTRLASSTQSKSNLQSHTDEAHSTSILTVSSPSAATHPSPPAPPHASPLSYHKPPPTGAPDVATERRYTTTLVVGRQTNEIEKTRWLDEDMKDVDRKAFYIVDDPSAPLHLDVNHGREAMVYLTYIVDHYDNLTDVTVFMHPHEKAWHNNLLLRRSAPVTINRLDRAHVIELGYFNTRCDLYPGCPNWIHFNPTKEEASMDPTRVMDMFTDKLWEKIFPNSRSPPEWLSAPCCSQFAVSKNAIRNVPLETFIRLRDWMAEEDLDMYSGRAMELLWHYIFTGKEELCPSIAACYCEAYGLCFEDDGLLDGWYHALYEEGKTGRTLDSYDRKIRGGKVGKAAEELVGDDKEHIRLVEIGRSARISRMEIEGQLKAKHALVEEV